MHVPASVYTIITCKANKVKSKTRNAKCVVKYLSSFPGLELAVSLCCVLWVIDHKCCSNYVETTEHLPDGLVMTTTTTNFAINFLVPNYAKLVVWLSCNALVLIGEVTLYLVSGSVCTWMGHRQWPDKLSQYVSSHPGQLGLATPLWIGTVSLSKSWGVKDASPGLTVVWQYKP